jgi:hypothetical protein
MADAPLRGYKGRHEWFWEPGDDDHIFPVESLVNMRRHCPGTTDQEFQGTGPHEWKREGRSDNFHSIDLI